MGDELIRIMIADDHALFRRGLISVLQPIERLFIQAEAPNGNALLEIIKSAEHKPHIVLLDLHMPVQDGIKTTRQLRRYFPSIKIIILTMHTDKSTILHLVESGAHGFIHKDSSFEELKQAIYTVKDQGKYISHIASEALLSTFVKGRQKHLHHLTSISLTPREQEIIELICQGLTNTEIGEKLFVSTRTVDGHRTRLMAKIGVHNTAGIVMYALKNGLVL